MRKFNYFRSLFLAVTLITSSLAFTSCDDDSDSPSGAYAEDGVFVLNEGNFGTPNGSISYYNNGSQEVQNEIFQSENNRILGDVIQNMIIHGDRAFIVANNSNKVEVVNAYTFKSLGTTEGLESPRYFVALNDDKGYVTEWVTYGLPGQVSVIDLNTYTVTKTITVGAVPEQLLLHNGKLYVANSGGKTVSVINTSTDAVETTIDVTDEPNSLQLDRNNNLWVLSSGTKAYDPWPEINEAQSTAGALTKINTSSNAVMATITFPKVAATASKLLTNGAKDKLYFIYDDQVYRQDASSTTFTATAIIDRSFYGLGVDPETGNIYGGDDNGFAPDGTVYIYDANGNQLSTFRVGVGPNGFVFR